MNDHPSERAVALMHQALEVLQRAEDAPASPVTAVVTGKRRRELRRAAARLRHGEVEPRYKNLHTAEQLADVYERTARRDEILERGLKDFKRIMRDLDRLYRQDAAAVRNALETFFLEALRLAEEHGPGSAAAQRFRLLDLMGWLGYRQSFRTRRQKGSAPWLSPLPTDPSVQALLEMMAADVLPSPPSSGEAVIAIPPEGQDSGRGRIFIRIGLGPASWIGSFERGHATVSTIFMLPDCKHLFVSAAGAGYIIDARSRTLVETVGTDVVGVMRNEPFTLFVVDHDGRSLEAFGQRGRLWKTEAISAGGFRGMGVSRRSLIGEARHPTRPGWVGFSVELATGEVRVGGGEGGGF